MTAKKLLCQASQHITTYQVSWETIYSFIGPVKNDKHKALCKACGSDFRIDNGGKLQIDRHANKEKHARAMLTFSKQRTLTSSSLQPQGSSASTSTVEPPTLRLSAIEKKLDEGEQVTKAEIVRALDIVHHNQTFASADSDNEKYVAMFPDSQIAKSYQQKSSKVNYVITHG